MGIIFRTKKNRLTSSFKKCTEQNLELHWSVPFIPSAFQVAGSEERWMRRYVRQKIDLYSFRSSSYNTHFGTTALALLYHTSSSLT